MDQGMRVGSALALGADVADKDDEQADEGEAKEQERGADERRHVSLFYGPTGNATRGRGDPYAGGGGQTAVTTGVAAHPS